VYESRWLHQGSIFVQQLRSAAGHQLIVGYGRRTFSYRRSHYVEFAASSFWAIPVITIFGRSYIATCDNTYAYRLDWMMMLIHLSFFSDGFSCLKQILPGIVTFLILF